MADVRRKFVDIQWSQGSPIAEESIGRIVRLYAVEKEARGSSPAARAELREANPAPAFDNLETWLAVQLPSISETSQFAGATRYTIYRMARLCPFAGKGVLELGNNVACASASQTKEPPLREL